MSEGVSVNDIWQAILDSEKSDEITSLDEGLIKATAARLARQRRAAAEVALKKDPAPALTGFENPLVQPQ